MSGFSMGCFDTCGRWRAHPHDVWVLLGRPTVGGCGFAGSL